MKKITNLFVVIFFMAISSDCFSVENNGRLFRVDLRVPDDVFNKGFQSLGRNNSLREHSRGTSCRGSEKTSAFISVSADPEYAARYARRLVQVQRGPVYVYIINSTRDMYNMTRSLSQIRYYPGIRDAEKQSEWIAYRTIPREDVIGVREYTTSDTSPPIRYNFNSLSERQSVINPNPYNSVEHDRTYRAPYYARLSPLVTACMAATLYCARQHENNSCSYIEKLVPQRVVLWDEL